MKPLSYETKLALEMLSPLLLLTAISMDSHYNFFWPKTILNVVMSSLISYVVLALPQITIYIYITGYKNQHPSLIWILSVLNLAMAGMVVYQVPVASYRLMLDLLEYFVPIGGLIALYSILRLPALDYYARSHK